MHQHPNRLKNPVNVEPQADRPIRSHVTVLTQEQYLKLEGAFPIDSRANHEFQLGVQAVLKKLRDGFVVSA